MVQSYVPRPPSPDRQLKRPAIRMLLPTPCSLLPAPCSRPPGHHMCPSFRYVSLLSPCFRHDGRASQTAMLDTSTYRPASSSAIPFHSVAVAPMTLRNALGNARPSGCRGCMTGTTFGSSAPKRMQPSTEPRRACETALRGINGQSYSALRHIVTRPKDPPAVHARISELALRGARGAE